MFARLQKKTTSSFAIVSSQISGTSMLFKQTIFSSKQKNKAVQDDFFQKIFL